MNYKIYYLTTEKDKNKPIYVGVTRNSLLRRLSGHKNDAKNGNCKVHTWIKNRISSKENIKIELIEEINIIDNSNFDIYFWEDFYIDLFKSWGFDLKNTLYSGYSPLNVNNKGKMSLEARQKLSKLYKNKKLSKEQIQLSINNRLIEAKRRGYYHSEYTKKLISKRLTGKKISDSEKIRLKEIRKNVIPKTLPILILNIKTKNVLYYPSIVSFEKEFKVHHSNICKVLKGERNHTKGFYFCKLGATCPIKTA